MKLPRKKIYLSMGHGTVSVCACYRAYHRDRMKGPKVWVSPNRQHRWVYNGSPAMDEQVLPIVIDRRLVYGADMQCK